MKYLLDTQIFLWWLNDDRKLKKSLHQVIEDSNNSVYVSVVNAWEMSIKKKIGKLRLKAALRTCFEKYNFEILNINLSHILILDNLPLHHRDPFDRLLIAQANAEKLTLLTADNKMKKYNVKILI